MMSRARLLIAAISAVMPNPIRIGILRHIWGAKVGSRVRIGFGTLLLSQEIEIGDGTRIGPFAYIRTKRFVTGREARIGHLARIGVHDFELRSRAIVDTGVKISGDRTDINSSCYIGVQSWIFPDCFVNVARPVRLGRNVGVGGRSLLFTHGLWLSALDGFPVKYGGITIEDDVWLPWSCFVMPDVVIGSRAVVGARSVINKNVPRDALVAGSPAKVIRDRSSVLVSAEQKEQLLLQLTTEFATSRAAKASLNDRKTSLQAIIDGRILWVLHRGLPLSNELARGALNIVVGELDRRLASEYPCLSLADSFSSPAALLPPDALAWLAFGRRIGIRFYPMDED